MEVPLPQPDAPTPDRRFVLQSSDYIDPLTQMPNPDAAKEVLRGVRDSWNFIQRTDPDYYVGAVVFGSSVKGTFRDGPDAAHREASDIDMMILIDPSRGDRAMSYQEMTDLHASSGEHLNANLQSLLGKLALRHKINVDGIGDAYEEIAINPQLIEQDIADTLEEHASDDYTTYEIYRKTLYAPFLMRVGKGKIPELRKEILDQVAKVPEPDLFWQAIAKRVRIYEEKNRQGSPYFPQTLEAAYKYFHIEHELA